MTQKLFEVTLQGSQLGRPTVNRFNYVGPSASSGLAGALGLLSALGANSLVSGAFTSGTLLGKLQALIAKQWVFQQVICISVYDPTDFGAVQFPQNTIGLVDGELASAMSAWGFKTNQVRRDIRRGHKRFAGVTITGTLDGSTINPSFDVKLSDMAAMLSANAGSTLTGDNASYQPVVVKKTKYTVPNTPTNDPDFAYHYDPVESVQMGKLAYGCVWEPYAVIRSQVSRQVAAR